jgi:hypothetical protein
MSSLEAQSLGRFLKVVLNTDGIAEGVARWIVRRARNFSGSYREGGFVFMKMASLGAASAPWFPKRGARG